MRGLSLIFTTAILVGCSTAPQPERSARQQARLQELVAGKVAGAPLSCLPNHRADDMVVIDDNTLAFRDGSRRTWVNTLRGGCSNIGSGNYALVTRQYGGTGLCRGDIAQVADLSNGFTVGSCVLGDFVPYTRAGG